MDRNFNKTFIPVGATPKIEKISGGAIAISPIAPIVAECGEVEDKYFIYITNYQTQEVIAKLPIAHSAHTHSFSPDGKYLFAMPGGKGFWKDLLVFSVPWNSPPIFHDNHSLHSAFHGAWLDKNTILIAGTIKYKELCIALLDVQSKSLKLIHKEAPQLKNESGKIDNAACSPSGLVSFSINWGRVIKLYRLKNDRNSVKHEHSFSAHSTGNSMSIAIGENGQIIHYETFRNSGVYLYNNKGKEIDYFFSSVNGLVYKYGCVCFRKHLGHGTFEAQVYRVRFGKFHFWCSKYISRNGKGCDLVEKEGKILVAIEDDGQTKIFELVDYDVLQLASENDKERQKAIKMLGNRRFKSAVPILARLLWDGTLDIQDATIMALSKIGDSVALNQLIRAYGRTPRSSLHKELESSFRHFPIAQLVSAVFDCIMRPGIAFRLGAVRVLESMPSIEAMEQLCEVIYDADREIRLSATHALRKRADIRACVALMAHLNDEDPEVRIAVQQAITQILKIANLLTKCMNEHLSQPLDISSYADEVISTGQVQGFDKGVGNPLIREFLIGLAEAYIKSKRPLPEILNAIEVLTMTHKDSTMRVSVSIALTVSLIIADSIRGKKRLKEAIGIYHNVITLSKRIQVPQIEWRAWRVVGECFERLGDDSTALKSFFNAMEVIDRMWFALLEEYKLQDFFQDKARLYDQAGLCCLRLGHKAFALECLEKAKTRYLGDLIARRQMNPRVALNHDIREFWKGIDGLRSVKASIGSSKSVGNGKVEIIGMKLGDIEIGTRVIKPKHRAAFEEVYQDTEAFQSKIDMLKMVWRLMSYIKISNNDDE